MTTSEPDPVEVLRQIDFSDIEPAMDAQQVVELSVFSSLPPFGEHDLQREVTDRLFGEGVEHNAIPARDAVRLIGRLQELLSAIGQSLEGKASHKGDIPDRVRPETELKLFAAPSPGSI